MFDHLLESSHRDDSNKWSNMGFGEEIRQVESIEVNFTNIIWSPDKVHVKDLKYKLDTETNYYNYYNYN